MMGPLAMNTGYSIKTRYASVRKHDNWHSHGTYRTLSLICSYFCTQLTNYAIKRNFLYVYGGEIENFI